MDRLVEAPSLDNFSFIRPFLNETLLILFNFYHQIVYNQTLDLVIILKLRFINNFKFRIQSNYVQMNVLVF
jgi:hypothetical protein